MKKKFITAALLAALLFIGSASAFAMTDSEAYQRGVSFGWADAEHALDKNITRAEFAEMVLKFAAMQANVSTVSQFDDIANGDERLSYINAAADQKIILPYLNNKFDPDGVVTKQQAARAVLTVLGYSQWAEMAGGYPSGYMKTAAGTKIFADVPGDASAVLTYSDALKVLANAAVVPLCEPVQKNGRLNYEVNEDKTILSEGYDADSVKGTIIANGVTSLTDGSVSKNTITVRTSTGDIRLNDGGNDVSGYIGYTATVYYRTVNNEDTLAYIVPDSKTEEITFQNKDVDSFSGGTYQYYEDGRRKTARVSGNANVIYNGRRVNDLSAFKDAAHMYFPRNDADIPKDGTIKLVSTDGSGNYDLVFVDVMDCYVVDHYGGANEAIYLKNNKPAFDVEHEDEYDIYDENGNAIELSSLKEWDVIEAYKAADGSYTKYVIVRKTVEGQVAAIDSREDYYDEIVINGNTYYYDNDGSIAIGTSGVFLLSSTDRIIMLTTEGVTHDVTFGYLVTAWCESYEEMGSARILNMDGSLVVYKLASSVRLDGVSYKKQSKMPLENRQLITYKLTNDEIKSIDTVKTNTSSSPSDLRILYSNTASGSASADEKADGLLFKKNLNCFGGRIIVDADTKIVTVPDPDSGFDNYSINMPSNLKNDKNYKNLTAYTLGEDSITAKVVVQEIAGGVDKDIDGEANIAVVDKLIKGINSRGDIADGISVYINGSRQELYGDSESTLGKTEGDSFYPLSKGDIIRYNLDGNGLISTIDPIYVQSYGALSMPDDFEKNIYGTDRRLACWAYERTGSFLGVSVSANPASAAPEKGDVVYFAAGSANVYIYDKSEKKVTAGTIDDIETYKTSGNDFSNLYVSAFKGEIKDVVVFKN